MTIEGGGGSTENHTLIAKLSFPQIWARARAELVWAEIIGVEKCLTPFLRFIQGLHRNYFHAIIRTAPLWDEENTVSCRLISHFL